VPARIDVLYVEQEVIADDTPAIHAVLKADKQRQALLEEEVLILTSLTHPTLQRRAARAVGCSQTSSARCSRTACASCTTSSRP